MGSPTRFRGEPHWPRVQFLPSHELPPFPYADYVRGLGPGGEHVDRPEDVRPPGHAPRLPIGHASSSSSPTPLSRRSPAATWDQIQNAAPPVVRGDSDREVLKEGVKTKVQDYLPGRRDG